MIWLIRAIGIVGIAYLGIGLWMGISGKKFKQIKAEDVRGSDCESSLPNSPPKFVLAMELPKSRCDIASVIGDIINGVPHPNRDEMRHQIRLDTFGFIPAYLLIYVLLGILLMQRGAKWAIYLGVITIICGIAAACFDLLENKRIINAVNLTLGDTKDTTAQLIRTASLWKWALSFMTIGILSSIFFNANRVAPTLANALCAIIGVIFVGVAIIGLCGVWRNYLLEIVIQPLAFGTLLLIALCLYRPQTLLP